MFFDPAIVSGSLNFKTVHFLDFEQPQAQAFEQAQADVWDLDDELLAKMEAREEAERGSDAMNAETFGDFSDTWSWPSDEELEEENRSESNADNNRVCPKLLSQRRRTKRSHVDFLPFF